MNRNESKYFNTARTMDEALIALLEKRDLEYITVKDLCKKAGVNRSTFYLHYETMDDLLAETLDYLNEQFHSYFKETSKDVLPMIETAPLEDLVFVSDHFLIPYLNYIREHKAVFAVAFRQQKLMHSNEIMDKLTQYIIHPIMQRFGVPKELHDYYNAFFMHGTLAVIQEWLKNGCKEEPEAISKIIESLCVPKQRAF